MYEFYYAFISVIFISSISLVGVFALSLKNELIREINVFLVAFAAGTLLGAAFFDILPEAVESGEKNVFSYVLFGIIIFFAMERYVYWHHCHNENCENAHKKPMAYLNLIGDAFHNFVDGLLIAASFLASIPLGIVTTFAIAAHEIPQEISDFAILIYGGFKKKEAIAFNFLSSLFAVLGVFFAFFVAKNVENFVTIILSIAGGGFIYIATADLIPEIHKETKKKSIIIQSAAIIFGIFVIVFLVNIFPE